MNSKQRVITAVELGEPDRVPLAYGATPEVTSKLKEYLNLESEEDMLQALKIDFRYVEPSIKVATYGDYFGDPLVRDLGNGRFRDIWGITFRRVQYSLGTYIEYESSPLSDITDVAELEVYPWPKVHDIWDFGNIKRDAQEKGDFAVLYDGAVLFQFCHALRGMERILVDLIENPELTCAIMDRVVDYWIEFGTTLLEEADGSVDFFVVNDDYGIQQGPLFDPGAWRKHLKPRVCRVIGAFKKYGAKIIFHSCGGVKQFIPDLIEIGVDVLDPVQVSAKDMDTIELKREFGDRLCFRGAIDTQRVLPYGTTRQVEAEVKKRIRDLAPRGGYIASSVHNLQPDVPLQNILAMYEAALKYGEYPIASS